ncbi:ABC transporter substrate-binding protein [Oceanirhabdus seepicola]|uniref:ABC transporter substrate-binding protein n=1 Tax=Oceanirhabdus seepicola TaxID=2828781 RepID=A0A9J6NZQ7_9CLOT|nr:ABC transporter substrate-binding protein [Oceanirhabdus seepicola]MCM1989914.1 ABC transporter substrate-binding protein [Oceanirhabdus seepicola]
MKHLKRNIIFSLLLIFTLSFLGCIKEDQKKPSNNSSNNSSNEKKNNNKEQAEQKYPIRIVDSLDRKVTIVDEPEKVISLAPNISEIIYALGKENLLVGRTALCDFPESILGIESIGDFYNPNIDKIVELTPDIIIMSSLASEKTLSKLDELKLPYMVINEDESIEGTYTCIEKIGYVLNSEKESEDLINEMKTKIGDISSKVSKSNKPRVHFIVDFGYSAGKDTYISQMINAAGAINAADNITGWNYSLEKLIESDPDIIIAPKKLIAQVLERNGYKDLRAVKNKKLYVIDDAVISRQGPRITDGIEILARIIHPDEFKEEMENESSK